MISKSKLEQTTKQWQSGKAILQIAS